MKKIAVLLATYNGENYIREQLESLRCQNFQDFVCYIHDDGSQDGTMHIVKEYHDLYPEQFVVMDGEATGSSKANFMFMLSAVLDQYEYYMFCDQDDVWLPDKIMTAYNRIQQEMVDIPCLVYSDMTVVDERLEVIAESFEAFANISSANVTFPNTMLRGYAAGCTMLMNHALAKLVVVPDTSRMLMHDWWIVLVASLTGKICHIETPLVLYRQHSNNVMGAKKRTGLGHMGEIFIRLITFKQYKITRKGLYDCIHQLAMLSEVDDVYKEHQELIDGAVNIHVYSKWKRCKYILRYGIYQNSYSKFWSCICI